MAFGYLWIYLLTIGQRRLQHLEGRCLSTEIAILRHAMAMRDAQGSPPMVALQSRLKASARQLQDYDKYINRLLQDVWTEVRRRDTTPDWVLEEMAAIWEEMLPRFRGHETTMERMGLLWEEFAPAPIVYPWA